VLERRQSPWIQKNNRAYYYYRCNANLYNNQQFDRALSDCNKAIELVPNDPDALGQRALVNQKMGRKAEAIADCRQALNYQLKEDVLESRDSKESQAYRSALKELGAKP